MFPKYQEIQLPLLSELTRRGGKAKPSDVDESGTTIYEALANYFNLTQKARDTKIYEATETERSKWENMVRWARNDLRKMDYLSAIERGIWAITIKGKKYLEEAENESIIQSDFNTQRVIDLQTFRKRQAEAIEIGELGERFALEYERKRLRKAGRAELAEKVKQISIENVAAGYDIFSFNSDGNHRYIEVKASKSKFIKFEITATELETARKYEDSYWIYRVTNVKSSSPNIVELSNPARLIMQGKLLIQPTAYRVSIGETFDH